MISSTEFAEIHDTYMTLVSRVEESLVFPWLHLYPALLKPPTSASSSSQSPQPSGRASDPFEVFERQFSHVVAVDGWGYRRNKIDFLEREREEMAALTRASEIAQNVWLGNSADVPLTKEDLSSSRQRAAFDERPPMVTSHFAMTDEYGNAPYNVCVEAHDQAVITSSLEFHLNQNYLDSIKQRAKNSSLSAELAEIIHMEVPSTGQSCSGAMSRNKLVRYLVDLCTWVKKIAKPGKGRAGRKVLIHCHDGYTETSLFAPSYIMYDLGYTLPDAYLHLQNDQNRSFFVYPADVQLLRRVESRIEQELHEQRKAQQMHRMAVDEPSRSSFLRGCVSFGVSSVHSAK
ncbi:hypothetical protein PtA15_2A169 [Puccinia triticina]|uniref:Tyrosine specific protein phosphatases domain-containing protein n=1 Tax=Puccinia triticina TaxID=208348 RepID=A0ABY7C9K1_9BASI|nr:uncharacterized protein PtA15_2A169 [Puccinia triticina]WAQ81856.1 hypothetical protein PtA15_2A169 [Puccinia triticina]